MAVDSSGAAEKKEVLHLLDRMAEAGTALDAALTDARRVSAQPWPDVPSSSADDAR